MAPKPLLVRIPGPRKSAQRRASAGRRRAGDARAKSKCVPIEKKWGHPLVCNDGVTIAKEFDLEDPDENLGAQVIREAAERTGDLVGDGTTTSTLLAAAMFAEGVRNIAADASAIDLKRGIDRALRVVVSRLKALSRPVADHKERTQAATIAAHNDPTIGETVASALERVGVEGTTSVEEAKGTETTMEVVEGDAVRPRLPVALLRHRSGENAGDPRGRADPAARKEN